MIKPEDLTDEQIRELRESIRNGTPETADHALFTLTTNCLAAFKEMAWNPSVWDEPYFAQGRARIAAILNARAAREAK